MLLKDNLYQILKSEKNESGFAYSIQISDKHPIFKGHFPESPVLPGVCILQIFKELSEDALANGEHLQYDEIKQCKFLTPVAMTEPAIVLVTLTLHQEDASWSISASMKSESTFYTSLKAVLTTI